MNCKHSLRELRPKACELNCKQSLQFVVANLKQIDVKNNSHNALQEQRNSRHRQFTKTKFSNHATLKLQITRIRKDLGNIALLISEKRLTRHYQLCYTNTNQSHEGVAYAERRGKSTTQTLKVWLALICETHCRWSRNESVEKKQTGTVLRTCFCILLIKKR